MKFQKGVSGNSSGRPKLDPELKLKIKDLGHEALDVLASLMRNSEDDNVRSKAAQYLADRHFGKASQPIEASGEISLIGIKLKK
jgi:hypothetical protein